MLLVAFYLSNNQYIAIVGVKTNNVNIMNIKRITIYQQRSRIEPSDKMIVNKHFRK